MKNFIQLTLLAALVLPTYSWDTSVLSIPGLHVSDNPRVQEAKIKLNFETNTFELLEVKDALCGFSPEPAVCSFKNEKQN